MKNKLFAVFGLFSGAAFAVVGDGARVSAKELNQAFESANIACIIAESSKRAQVIQEHDDFVLRVERMIEARKAFDALKLSELHAHEDELCVESNGYSSEASSSSCGLSDLYFQEVTDIDGEQENLSVDFCDVIDAEEESRDSFFSKVSGLARGATYFAVRHKGKVFYVVLKGSYLVQKASENAESVSPYIVSGLKRLGCEFTNEDVVKCLTSTNYYLRMAKQGFGL